MSWKARILHISYDDESDADEFDLRTRTGNEKLVLKQIEEHGGFSIFWATDNPKRASAVNRLISSEKIVRQKDRYPWCSYIINQE